jgi:hypothetical protein
MARKLKTFETSLGFYDLAIAAPSMKAALEAWGADNNLFHQGAARQTDDPDIIAATLAKPGVVLKRPVGSDGPFKEHADLPTDLAGDAPKHRSKNSRAKSKRTSRLLNDKTAREAGLAFEQEQKRRDAKRRKEEAARARERERRGRAVAKAQTRLDQARRDHERRAAAIEAERAALDERAQAEETRWEKHREKLDAAVRRARD